MSLEAMASGCLVVGYTGHGGSEYATEDNGIWVEDGNHAEFARKLSDACALVKAVPLNSYVENAIATARTYSLENFRQQLKEVYLAIMGPTAERFRK
jgi:glycosyltransferase involved in cell wall biosynthesis